MFTRTLGAGTHDISPTDLNLLADTSLGTVTINLPNINNFYNFLEQNQGFSAGASGLNTYNITDITGSASVNNIIINTNALDTFVGNTTQIIINTDFGSASIKPVTDTAWTFSLNPNGGGGGGNAVILLGVGNGSSYRCGQGNLACGNGSTISGGYNNCAVGTSDTISGGYVNCTQPILGNKGSNNTISGGYCNTVIGQGSTISGGNNNYSSAKFTTIAGGKQNTASQIYSSIGGGQCNTTSSISGVVGGGFSNTSSGYYYSTVSGGTLNIASGISSFVGGGGLNSSSGYASSVSGGSVNTASADYSVVGGGYCNHANSISSTISGGYNNKIATALPVIVVTPIDGSPYSYIGGGIANLICSGFASGIVSGACNNNDSIFGFIGAGFSNNLSGGCAGVIGGGCNNTTSGSNYGGILGGKNNDTCGCISAFIIGSDITANRDCATFVNNLSITQLPTSSAGLPSGSLYYDNSAGNCTIKYVP